jgi:hypothetical protein
MPPSSPPPHHHHQQQQQDPEVAVSPADQLTIFLNSISFSISSLDERKHERLLRELLETNMWLVPQSVRSALLDIITHLVVACSGAVQACLHALVYALMPPHGFIAPTSNHNNNTNNSNSNSNNQGSDVPGQSWHPPPSAALIQDEVLLTLSKTLALVPTAAHRTLPLIQAIAPHRLRERATHCYWLRAVTHLAEEKHTNNTNNNSSSSNMSSIREPLLAGIVEHLITIDVELRWEDIVDVVTEEAVEEEGGIDPGEEEEPDIFDIEGMHEEDMAIMGTTTTNNNNSVPVLRGGWEGGLTGTNNNGNGMNGVEDATISGDGNGNGVAEITPPPSNVNETADKLDSLMEATLSHIQRRIEDGQLEQTWQTLLSSFEHTVLHTHRSKFTQYLIFYAAKQAPEPCCRSFLSMLLSKLTDKSQPSVTRCACAAYLASFLARAAYIPEVFVVESLHMIADWCVKYATDENRRGGLPPIPSASNVAQLVTSPNSMSSGGVGDAGTRHMAFYAACQALLYALCYHVEPLLHHYHSAVKEQQKMQQQQQQQSGGGEGGSVPSHAAVWPTGSAGSGDAFHNNNNTNTLNGSSGGGGGGGGFHYQKYQHHYGQHSPASSSLSQQQQQQQQQQPMSKHAQRKANAETVISLCTDLIPTILAHKQLDPLSSCARSVVVEFERQMTALGFVQASIVIRNWESAQHQQLYNSNITMNGHTHDTNGNGTGNGNCTTTPTTTTMMTTPNPIKQQQQPSPPVSTTRHRPLEVFFPFDPYLLARSATILELDGTYVSWKRGHPSGAVRAGLSSSSSSDDDDNSDDDSDVVSSLSSSSSDDDDMMISDDGTANQGVKIHHNGKLALNGDADDSSSGLDTSSSDSSDDDTTDDDNNIDNNSNTAKKRNRFGSLANSSYGSGGHHRHRGGGNSGSRRKKKLPPAMRVSLAAGYGNAAGSPTMGFIVPGAGGGGAGSASTENGGYSGQQSSLSGGVGMMEVLQSKR